LVSACSSERIAEPYAAIVAIHAATSMELAYVASVQELLRAIAAAATMRAGIDAVVRPFTVVVESNVVLSIIVFGSCDTGEEGTGAGGWFQEKARGDGGG